MNFLKDFNKSIEKMDGVTTTSEPPRYWFSFGNYALNKIMSDSYFGGIPQGRVTAITGPSGSGKSYLAGNVIKSAQDDGAFILVIDSEEALDDGYMQKIGVDTEDNYSYVSVTTIPQVSQVVSSFLKGYRAEYGTGHDAPKILIVIDSLDMLMTESEEDNYDKGKTKGDQGQRAKQLKAMLRTFVQDIKGLNVSMVCTSQVFQNQDLLNGEGKWVVNQAVRYAMSQIVLVTKLKLRDKSTGESEGILLKAEAFKTRFAKPFQTVALKVPYDTGIKPHSGLLGEDGKVGIAEKAGVVLKKGSRKLIKGEDTSWFAKDVTEEQIQKILSMLEGKEVDLTGEISDDDSED